jgi:hypothetical protein
MEAILEFGRGSQNLSTILWGVCGWGGGGGAVIITPYQAQARWRQVAPGCKPADLVVFINPVSLSSPSTFLCIAAAVRLSLDKN